MKIGVKRPEKPIEKTVGPGAYNPSKADDLTRSKSPTTKMSKASSRPKSFANPSQENIGPGAYSDGKKFGEGIKTFKIGQKREEKIGGGVGPGQYNPDKAEAVTKPNAPKITFANRSPNRPENFANAGQVGTAGPGAYDSPMKFGYDVKSFKIGEKRPEKVGEGIGPGQYSPERAESVTKAKTPVVLFSKQASRPQSFANPGQIEGVAPGQYDDGKDFLSDVKGFKIGEKRP